MQKQATQNKQNVQQSIVRRSAKLKESVRMNHHPYLQAQDIVGNHGILGRYVSNAIQTKLNVSSPNDKYEQEADRVAEQVICTSETAMHPHAEQEGQEVILRTNAGFGQISEVRTKLEARINNSRSSGQPLPASTRTFFEPRFGHDFSRVRVHTDSNSAEAAGTMNALAFTVGRDITFGSGEYAPGTVEGRRLLAHELTHVIQTNNVTNTDSYNKNLVIHRKENDNNDSEKAGNKEESPIPGAVKEAAKEFANDIIISMGETIIAKHPYGKALLITSKLSHAFADGVAKEIINARKKYDTALESYLSEHGRRNLDDYTPEEQAVWKEVWYRQYHATQELSNVIKSGISQAILKFVDIALQAIVDITLGKMFGRKIKKLAKKTGDFFGDLVTGDYVKSWNFFTQVTEDKIEATVAELIEFSFDVSSGYISGIMVEPHAIGEEEGTEEIGEGVAMTIIEIKDNVRAKVDEFSNIPDIEEQCWNKYLSFYKEYQWLEVRMLEYTSIGWSQFNEREQKGAEIINN
ncbi:MAG: DUF4157 domain-containing protein [Deltaproteobacteria bacterium]|nr:DUF4157 domain-containing protein [Deltaproteobacteria bacterium]